jgi:hypothetical protein
MRLGDGLNEGGICRRQSEVLRPKLEAAGGTDVSFDGFQNI